MNNGCAETAPSTVNAPSLPNCFALTFCGVNVFSMSVAPVRELSYCEVVTCATTDIASRAKMTNTKQLASGFMRHSLLLFCRRLRGLGKKFGIERGVEVDFLDLGVAGFLSILLVLMFVRHGHTVGGAPVAKIGFTFEGT